MDRRLRVSRKGKLEGWGKPDLKMPSSTIEKFVGGTNTTSFSSSSNIINPIALAFLIFKKQKTLSRSCKKMQYSTNRRRRRRRRKGYHGFNFQRRQEKETTPLFVRIQFLIPTLFFFLVWMTDSNSMSASHYILLDTCLTLSNASRARLLFNAFSFFNNNW